MKETRLIAPLPQHELPMQGDDRVTAEAEEFGYSLIPRLLDKTQCEQLKRIYDEPDRFRNKIIMARHQFGQGEYQYFNYPLPPIVQELRAAFYSCLVPVASLS